MATRKAVARAAIDSIKPLHVRSTSVLGGRPAWGVGGGAAPHSHRHRRGGNSGGHRMLAPQKQPSRISGGRVRDNLVGPSRASLVQGGRHRPSPLSLVQGGGSAQPNNNSSNNNNSRAVAPSLVQGRTTQASQPPSRQTNLVNGTAAAASSAAKLNGVPIQYQQPPQHQTYQQSRAELVRGRRSTLGGVVTLANGQRVNGARPAYLLRREAQQQQHQQQHQQQSHSRYKASSTSSSSNSMSANPGGGAVVTDLSADETDSSSSSSSDDGSNSPGRYESDLVVVLDMDECLIHSQFLSQQAQSFSAPELDSGSSSSDNDGDGTAEQEDKYRQPDLRPTKSSAFHTDGEEAESIIASNCEYFRIHLPDGDLVHVNKRPNLDSFLADVTARFETHIFTAALDVYANPLLDRLEVDLGTKFAGRFYREHCVLDPDLGVYVKDLGLILDKDQDSAADWSSAYEEEEMKECDDDFASSDLSSSFNEGRVVLVDNNPLSFLANPSNGILVSNFYDDPKDATLEAVMELLLELDQAEDVRPVLESKFGLKDALRDVVRSSNSNSWR